MVAAEIVRMAGRRVTEIAVAARKKMVPSRAKQAVPARPAENHGGPRTAPEPMTTRPRRPRERGVVG